MRRIQRSDLMVMVFFLGWFRGDYLKAQLKFSGSLILFFVYFFVWRIKILLPHQFALFEFAQLHIVKLFAHAAHEEMYTGEGLGNVGEQVDNQAGIEAVETDLHRLINIRAAPPANVRRFAGLGHPLLLVQTGGTARFAR